MTITEDEKSVETATKAINYLDISQYTIVKVMKILFYLMLGLFKKKKIVILAIGLLFLFMKRHSIKNAFIYLLNFILFGKFKGKEAII
jgi:hypothetical protein